jgi:hypothetical protein
MSQAYRKNNINTLPEFVVSSCTSSSSNNDEHVPMTIASRSSSSSSSSSVDDDSTKSVVLSSTSNQDSTISQNGIEHCDDIDSSSHDVSTTLPPPATVESGIVIPDIVSSEHNNNNDKKDTNKNDHDDMDIVQLFQSSTTFSTTLVSCALQREVDIVQYQFRRLQAMKRHRMNMNRVLLNSSRSSSTTTTTNDLRNAETAENIPNIVEDQSSLTVDNIVVQQQQPSVSGSGSGFGSIIITKEKKCYNNNKRSYDEMIRKQIYEYNQMAVIEEMERKSLTKRSDRMKNIAILLCKMEHFQNEILKELKCIPK